MKKFDAAATRNARTAPGVPPTAPPTTTNSAVSPAISTNSFALFIEIAVSHPPRSAHQSDRTDRAARRARGADGRAEVHQRLVPVAGAAAGDETRGEAPERVRAS